MVGLMSDIRPEALPHNAVPAGSVHNVELGLNELRDILFNSELLKCSSSTVDSVLGHSWSEWGFTLIHLNVFEDCLGACHNCLFKLSLYFI